MRPPQRFLFFADSGAAVGGGHVMRSLTLARALAARGAACAFVGGPDVRAILDVFGDGAVAVAPGAEPAAAAAALRADWLIVDHYRLVRADETALRAPGRRIAVVDDLAERPRDCDLLLDPSYGRTAADYAGLLPHGAALLTGPRYALVRPDFAAARPSALARRGGPVRRVLVSLGLTDVGGVTGRVVRALLPLLGDAALDIVLGAAAPSLTAMRELAAVDRRLSLHVDTLAMAGLMTAADLAIGAGGSSTWERACLGLPSITLVLADNQRPLARAFDRDGVSVSLEIEGLEAALPGAWARLVDSGLRKSMSDKGAGLCDGLGAGRVAEALVTA